MKQTIFITGAAGFVGSNFVQKAMKAGHDIIALVRSGENEHQGVLRLRGLEPYGCNLKIEIGNILDEKCIKHIFDNNKIDTVVHLAAKVRAPEAEQELKSLGKNNSPTMLTNREGTEIVAKIADNHANKINKTIKFYYTCSSHAFSEDERGYIDENTNINPLTFYGKTKVEGAEKLNGRKNLSTIIVYPTNHYGIYEKDSFFIPKIINRALKGEQIDISNNYQQPVELIHVDRHTEIILSVIEKPPEKNSINRYCIEGDVIKTLKDISFDICKILDKKLRSGEISSSVNSFQNLIVTAGNDKEYEMRKFLPTNGKKITEQFGYPPNPSQYESNLESTVDHYVKVFKLSQLKDRKNDWIHRL